MSGYRSSPVGEQERDGELNSDSSGILRLGCSFGASMDDHLALV